MRTLLGVLAIGLLASACSIENDLRYTSTLDSQTRGVALSEQGFDAYVGMIDTTCTIDTNWGCPTEDVDLPSSEDRILDHFGQDTLGGSPDAVHIIRGSAWQEDLDLQMPGVRAAVLRADGPVILAGSGATCALHLDDGSTISAPGAACEDGAQVAFDRDHGAVFVATHDQVIHVSQDGPDVVAEYGDLVAYDHRLGMIYVAKSGELDLFGLRTDGAQVWSVEASGPITSIEARGRLGQVLVMTEGTDGFGVMERRDGRSGELLDRYRLPDTECDLVTSDNGRTIGCVRADEVNFYELDDDLEQPVVDEDPPANCMNPIERRTLD